MGRVLLFLLTLLSFPAQASYRVYFLKLEHYNTQKKLERIEYVKTNLDPFQYEHYYGGYRWTKVIMIDHWFCPGDTGHFRPYCARPKPDRAPASDASDPKRVPLPLKYQPIIPR